MIDSMPLNFFFKKDILQDQLALEVRFSPALLFFPAGQALPVVPLFKII
jgi:hypothetical protein